MAKIIAITNQKGGVGKTTTSINLSAALAVLGCRILLLDLDPQSNATAGSGITKADIHATISDLLTKSAPINSAILPTQNRYDIIPTTTDLTAVEIYLLQQNLREQQLKQLLGQIQHNYDYILIDCPPTLNILTVNALVAAQSVLIPVQCEYYALEGLSSLLLTIEQIQVNVNPDLYIEGLLRTMFDGRNRLTLDVSNQLLAHFKDQVYTATIPRNVRIAEAPSHGLSILYYDSKSQGAIAYLNCAKELIKRNHIAPRKVLNLAQETE